MIVLSIVVKSFSHQINSSSGLYVINSVGGVDSGYRLVALLGWTALLVGQSLYFGIVYMEREDLINLSGLCVLLLSDYDCFLFIYE